MINNRHKLDLYVLEENAPDLPIDHILQKHQVKIIGKGFALNYINIFGSATTAAIDELKALPNVHVNQYPPEIQADIDSEIY